MQSMTRRRTPSSMPPSREIREERASEIRRHDDDGVLGKSIVRPLPSVNRPSSRSWSSTFRTSGCAFSISVEQHHRVRRAPDRLGQLSRFLVSDVSRGRTKQPRHLVRFS